MYRKGQGLTLIECAERFGISKSVLSDLERGNRAPTVPLLKKLSQMTEIPVEDLVNSFVPETTDDAA